jgi:F0F1-type ATP synthase assembly protein I
MQINPGRRKCLIVAGIMIAAGVALLILRPQVSAGLPAVVALMGGLALFVSAAIFILAAAVKRKR